MPQSASLSLDPSELLEEASAAVQDERTWHTGGPGAPGGRTQIVKIRYSHDAMIDLLVANPRATQNEIANHFGYSTGWISTVMATDLFQERLAQRRGDLVDPLIRASIEERFKGVVLRSLTVLAEKLSAPSNQIPDNLVLRAAELGARGASLGGFSANAQPVAPPPAPDTLSLIAERLLALQGNVRAQRNLNAEDATIVREG